MRQTPPVVVSTTAAPHGIQGHYRRTVATEVSYVVRRSITTSLLTSALKQLLTPKT